MSRFKVFLSVLLAVLMLVVSVACGNGAAEEPSDKGQTTGQSTSSGTTSNTGSSTTGSAEPVEILFWDMVVGGDSYPQEAEKHAADITKDLPNIKIKYQSIPWANRYETFTTAIAAGEGPDFSTGGGYQSFQFAAAGEIMDVSSIVEEWKADGTLNNYNQDLITYFQYNGMQVGIPWNYEPRYMVYRKDWFERDGIKVPTNWDELYAAAVHFTDKSKGIYGLAYPTSGSAGNVLFNLWFAMNGTGVWKEDGKTPDWTNPKNLETLNFITKLKNAGVFPEGMAEYESNEVVQLALQDKVAMCMLIMGSSAGQFKTAGVADKWAIMPVPSGPSANGNQGYVAAINAIMAYSQADHPEETKQAMKWWCENMFDLWTNNVAAVSGIPVREDWLKDPKFINNTADPYVQSFVDLCLDKTHSLIYPAKNIVGWLTQNSMDGERWWTNLSQAILAGEKSNEALLQECQEKTIKYLKDFDEYAE